MEAVQNSVANMTVKDKDKDYQIIVIALDHSDSAEHAVNWYINHVHKPGNKMVFVHCIELPELKSNQAKSLHMSPGVLASMWKEEENKTKELEDKIKHLLKEKGLSGMLRTATGKPGEVICRIAEEEGAVMIITGSRGMGKMRRTILGSVSDYIVHHAICPVTVVRHPEAIARQQRRHSSSSDGSRSRHASGASISDGNRSRHTSGKILKSRSQSQSSDVFE